MTLTSTSPLDHPAYAGIAFAPRRYTVPGTTKTGTMFAPESWSQTAVTILATKYARRAGVPDATVKVLEDGIPEQFARSVPAENATFGGEADVRQVLHRLAGAWTYFGLKGRYFADETEAEQFYSDALRAMIDQEGAPNSPQWFNTGLYFAYGISGNAAGYWYFDEASSAVIQSGSSYEKLAPMACFISTVEDSLVGEGGIFDWIATEARIFKLGAGSGANVSRLRAAGEKLAGGGTSSGLMSFLAVSDRAAGAIKSGGTTRRAAKMIVLDDDHPELPVFIAFKPKEEAKVAALIAGSFAIEKHVNAILAAAASKDLPEDGRLDPKRNTRLAEALRSALAAAIPSGTIAQAIDLANQGYSSVELDVHDSDWQGEAYMTIAGQNANISIGASDRFMRTCDSRTAWTLRGRVDDSVNKDIDAGDLWDKLSFAAWQCADPGLLFLDTIDSWHTHHADGLIRSSNPCGEYLAADGTACNLASINLVKFLHADGSFDVTRFENACALWTLILEISVFAAHLPTAETALRTYQIRNLGLGYTSVGSLLMRLGLPYDSEAGRSYIAAITGLMTGVAYRTSRDIAKRVAPCESYPRNRDSMQRVLRNHARAAGVTLARLTKGFEGLNYEPYLPEPNLQSAPITSRSIEVWGDVVDTEFAARNMQVTLCAPTGTISLVMDADTMGLEPDFALLKHKQLAGGGYIRIANESVNPALRSMGYSEKQVDDIIAYIAGTQTFSRGEAGIHRQALLEYLSEATLDAADAALRSSFAIDDALLGALNESEQARFDASEKQSVLESLGFSSEQIRKAQDVILGRGTIEGAPHLSKEHLPVFDCAMPSGRGERCVSANGHLKMVAAVQPLISGAASKTINLPRSTTVKEIGDTYFKAWRLGLKGITVYRDGSKLSQPLSTSELGEGDMTTADAVREPLAVAERIVYRYIAKQRKLPDKRSGYTQKMTIAGDQKFFLRTGEYDNGELGEIFLDAHKEGSAFRALLNNFAIAISMGLQHGVPLEEYVNAYTFTTFEPNGPVTGHAQIKMCKSLLDLVFRDLAVNYLGREDLAHVAMPDTRDHQAPMPEFIAEVNGDGLYGVPITNGTTHNGVSHLNGHIVHVAPRPPATSVAVATRETTGNVCRNCGSFDLVRSGTCETCSTCGTASGGCA
jgi:ribonucleoside-diphosphate reductase alpha chain